MVVLTNARIFDGREMLAGTHDVVLDGNRIAAIDDRAHAGSGAGPGDTIDVAGMTLMPGLITCHLHPDFYKFDIFAGEKPGKELPPVERLLREASMADSLIRAVARPLSAGWADDGQPMYRMKCCIQRCGLWPRLETSTPDVKSYSRRPSGVQ